MKKINHKIFSIPPYISTSWGNINTLYIKEIDNFLVLVVVLKNETIIEIPNLDSELIHQIFETHTNYMEQLEKETPRSESCKQCESKKGNKEHAFLFGIPFQTHGNTTSANEEMKGLHSFLQHNPEHANLPKMPPEIIQKIASITKTFGMDMDQIDMPKAEPHCNCPYCQIARAMYNENEQEESEEIVTEDDLRFRDWDIKQEGDKLYIVTNPLNAEEHYQVFLGNPIGCTCGKKNCEHVRTVLNS